jgi:hypothetical protein
MIQLKASFKIELRPLSGGGDLLEKDSSEKKLFRIIKEYLKGKTTERFSFGHLALHNGLSLFRHNKGYWLVAETRGAVPRCLGCFQNYHSAGNFFIYHLVNPYPRNINWEALFLNDDFLKQLESNAPPQGYIIEPNPAARWFKIESDLPDGFFQVQNDVFDKFGYVKGQKIIFEAVKQYLAGRKKPVYNPVPLGDLGWDEQDFCLYEAGGYWVVSIPERGERNFNGIFRSYRTAVDYYIMKCIVPAPATIDWGSVFEGPPW